MGNTTLKWVACIICFAPLLAGAADTEVLPAADAERLFLPADRGPARTGHENEVIFVNKFTGGLLAKFHDVHIPGNGGMDIDIYRVFNSAGSKGAEWGPTFPHNKSFAYAALGRAPSLPPPSGQNLWSFLAAPTVGMNVAFRPNPETFPQTMADDLDRVCTQVPWRTSGGLYGLIVAYTLTLPSGEAEPLVPVETGVVRSRSGWKLTCAGGQGGVHTLVDPTGRRYTMGRKVNDRVCERIDSNICWNNQTLLATQQTDLVGNWLQYGYTDYTESPGFARSYLTSISASDGRSLTLSYVNTGSHYRLSQISGPRGAVWAYQFNSAGNLTAVTMPEGRAWLYAYWPDSPLTGNTILGTGATVTQPDWAKSGLLQRVTYPTGGHVDINYAPSQIWSSGLWWWEGDPGAYNEDVANNSWPFKGDWIMQWNMRVTSLAYSDGGSWTFSYTPSRTQGVFDVTTVTGPSGVETYKHMGEGYFVPSSSWVDYGAFAFATLVGGSWSYLTDAWRLGLLVEKRIGTSRVETYTWTPRVHSSIFYHATSGRAGLRDETSKVADLAQKTVVQDSLTYTTVYSNYDAFGNAGTIVESGPGGSQRTITRSYYIDLANNILRQPKDETITLNAP